MPYTRQGALKVSDHWVRSPLLNVNRACQQCHPYPEADLLARAEGIQARNHALLLRSAASLVEMIDAVNLARANGAADAELKPALDLHRRAQWRLDFVSSENSMGFHAGQESARILAESIDFSRQGQLAAQRLLLRPNTQPSTRPAEPVEGVTPSKQTPTGANPQFPADNAGDPAGDRPPRGPGDR
jgi:nitrite reductase (cytochrome c-552)